MNFRKIIDFCAISVVPILTLLLMFAPNLYEAITEPEELYAYSTEYSRNPVLEWNRSISRFLKQVDNSTDNISDQTTKPLLKKIGVEITNALPAILADTGFRPMDKYTVSIVNMSSRYDLKNVKIHFSGCEGVV